MYTVCVHLYHVILFYQHSRAVRYDDIYRMDEIKVYRFLLCSIVYIVVSQNTSFPVIPFHHLSDCNLYTPPTTGREGESDASGGERPARS